MNDNADNDPRIHAIPDIHGHAKGEHKAFSDERPIPLSARMLFLWFYHACRRGWPRFLMVTDHMNYLTFEDPAAINLVRRALKLAQAGDLYGAAETASVEVGHAAVVSEGLRRGMRYSIGAEVDNDPRSRPDAQNIVDAMKPDGMIRSVHFLTIDHPTHGPNWSWPFDNPEFADVYDIIGTAKTWEIYMTTLLDAVERLPGNILGHFYVPALFGHWPDDATLETYEDQIVAACAQRGMAIELNTRFLYRQHSDEERAKYMAAHRRLLAKCKAKDVGVAVGSDAHSPKDQGRAFATVLPLLDDCGINELVYPIAGRLAHVALRVERKVETPPAAVPAPAMSAADDRKALRKPRTSEAPARSKDSSSKRDESYASDEAADDAAPMKAKPRPKRSKNRTAASPEAGEDVAASTDAPAAGDDERSEAVAASAENGVEAAANVSVDARNGESAEPDAAAANVAALDATTGDALPLDSAAGDAADVNAAAPADRPDPPVEDQAAVLADVRNLTAGHGEPAADEAEHGERVEHTTLPQVAVTDVAATHVGATDVAADDTIDAMVPAADTVDVKALDAGAIDVDALNADTVDVEALDADAIDVEALDADAIDAAMSDPDTIDAAVLDVDASDAALLGGGAGDAAVLGGDIVNLHPTAAEQAGEPASDVDASVSESSEGTTLVADEPEEAAAMLELAVRVLSSADAADEGDLLPRAEDERAGGEARFEEPVSVETTSEIVVEATLEPIVTSAAVAAVDEVDDIEERGSDVELPLIVGRDALADDSGVAAETPTDLVEAAVYEAAAIALASEPVADAPPRRARARPSTGRAKVGSKAKPPAAKSKPGAKKPAKPAAKPTAKKPTAKKASAKKTVAKSAPAKKSAAKKTTASKAAVRPAAAKKAGAKKAAAKKAGAKKPAPKRR